MRVVFIDHPEFQAEVLHLSEIPDDVVNGVREDHYGLWDTVIEIFRIGLIDPGKYEQFEELKVSVMLQLWWLYNSAQSYVKDFE